MKPSLVIIGLGNPGKSYQQTRHNVGFLAVEMLAKEFGTGGWKQNGKFDAEVCEGRMVTAPVLFVKPQTFMNSSGDCARKLTDFYKLTPATQLLVIVDDLDLPLGEIRVRKNGGPGTHNGMRSLVQALGENFPRVRIGLGQPLHGEDLATWVLSVPAPGDRELLYHALQSVPEKVKEFVLHDTQNGE